MPLNFEIESTANQQIPSECVEVPTVHKYKLLVESVTYERTNLFKIVSHPGNNRTQQISAPCPWLTPVC